MKKLIVAAMLVVLVSGCAGKQIRIRSEVQEVQVPLLYCPAPPELNQPVLPIQEMTEEQKADPGEVAKYYKATVRALLGYVGELEKALDSYDATNEAYDELRNKFQGEWQKEFTDSADPQPIASPQQ